MKNSKNILYLCSNFKITVMVVMQKNNIKVILFFICTIGILFMFYGQSFQKGENVLLY